MKIALIYQKQIYTTICCNENEYWWVLLQQLDDIHHIDKYKVSEVLQVRTIKMGTNYQQIVFNLSDTKILSQKRTV